MDSKEFNRSFTRYLRNPAVIALVSALGMWDLTAVGVYSRIREAQKQSEEEEKKHTAAAMAASAAIALTNPVSTAIATIHYVRYRKKKSEK